MEAESGQKNDLQSAFELQIVQKDPPFVYRSNDNIKNVQYKQQ